MNYLPKLLLRVAACAIASCSFALSQKQPVDPSRPLIPPKPGILANTLTGERLTVPKKFEQRIIQQFGWRGFVGAAIGGGIGQGFNTPKEWGQSWSGFGQRYASSYGVGLSNQTFTFGMESILHEDPRYFPSSQKGFQRRFRNVLVQSLVAKNDDGHATLAYARFAGAFGAGFLANTWQPKSTNSVGDAFERGALILAANATVNLIQEFLPFTRNSYFRRRP